MGLGPATAHPRPASQTGSSTAAGRRAVSGLERANRRAPEHAVGKRVHRDRGASFSIQELPVAELAVIESAVAAVGSAASPSSPAGCARVHGRARIGAGACAPRPASTAPRADAAVGTSAVSLCTVGELPSLVGAGPRRAFFLRFSAARDGTPEQRGAQPRTAP